MYIHNFIFWQDVKTSGSDNNAVGGIQVQI